MDKLSAALTLMHDARDDRRLSTERAKRVLRACRTLRLEPREILTVFGWLEYCDTDGKPYHAGIKPVWSEGGQ